MKNAIDSINSKYKDFFSKISGHYKNMILLEEMRIVDRTNALFNGFSLEKMLVEYKENIKADIKVIEEHADPLVVERMKNDLNEETFIAALKSALRTNQLPMVTLEAIFRGKPAWKQKEPMFGKRNMIEIESNAFMNYWYPDETSNIILDILKEAKIIS